MELPDVGWGDVPAWIWFVSGVVCWYVTVARLMRRERVRRFLESAAIESDGNRISFWMFSPFLIPTIIVALIVAYIPGTMAWLCGVTDHPPWVEK